MPTKTTEAYNGKKPLFLATCNTGKSPPTLLTADKTTKTSNDKTAHDINEQSTLCPCERFFPHDKNIAQPNMQLNEQYCTTFMPTATLPFKTQPFFKDENSIAKSKTTTTGTNMVFNLFIVLTSKQSPTPQIKATKNENGKFVAKSILNNACEPAIIAETLEKQVKINTASKKMPDLPKMFLFITEMSQVLYLLPSDRNKKTRQKNKIKKQTETNNGFFPPKNTAISFPVKNPTPRTHPTTFADTDKTFIFYFIAF